MNYQYFKGVFTAFLGTGYMTEPIAEWQIDLIKESLSQFCEAKIVHTCLSYQEKEEEKRKMTQDLEMYIQGVKNGLKTKRMLI